MNNVRNALCNSRRVAGFTRIAREYPVTSIHVMHISNGVTVLGIRLQGQEYSPTLAVFPFKYEGAWGVI